MEINRILKGKKKTIRKLANYWASLTNIKNYIIPKTIDEWKSIDDLGPKFSFKSAEFYLNDKIKKTFQEFNNEISKLPIINEYISLQSIYEKILIYIKKAILRKDSHKPEIEPEKYFKSIIKSLIKCKKDYQFYYVVEGIKFIDIDSLDFGTAKVFIFKEDHIEKLKKQGGNIDDKEFFTKYIQPMLKEYFLGKTCIRTDISGDYNKAEKFSNVKAHQVLNILRFIAAFLGDERISDNLIKINLLSNSYGSSGKVISICEEDGSFSVRNERGKTPLFTFDIDAEMINSLKENFFLKDLISILDKEKKTKLEKAILTSIYWIGEAQNEFDSISAFIKYWTALEALYTQDKEAISESLAKGIAISLAVGGYRFIELDDINKIHKSLKNLYSRRSKIVHFGNYDRIKAKELSEICKYASRIVFTCLGLRSLGYSSLKQIKNETNRLYRIHLISSFSYVASKNSKIFHSSKCKKIKSILHRHLYGTNIRKDMTRKGKTPCKICQP